MSKIKFGIGVEGVRFLIILTKLFERQSSLMDFGSEGIWRKSGLLKMILRYFSVRCKLSSCTESKLKFIYLFEMKYTGREGVKN
jgi:hypothetical protein